MNAATYLRQNRRVEDFLAAFREDRDCVRELREEKIGNGVLNFYQYKGIVFIVQRFKEGGIEVYVSAPGNKIEFACEFVKKTEELRAEMDEAGIGR